MQINRLTPTQMPSNRPAPRFAALTLEVGKPVPFIIVNGKNTPAPDLEGEMKAVGNIFQNWMTAHKAQIDKILKGRDVKVKVMNGEEFNNRGDKPDNKYYRTLRPDYGALPDATQIGVKFYLQEEGKETRLQIRWPGNSPDGPTSDRDFKYWAEPALSNPEALYKRLTKALKMGVSNLSWKNTETYEGD